MTSKEFKQLEAIRRSGKTNMLQKNNVQRIAFENDFHALVTKIEEAEYFDLLDGIPIEGDIEYSVE